MRCWSGEERAEREREVDEERVEARDHDGRAVAARGSDWKDLVTPRVHRELLAMSVPNHQQSSIVLQEVGVQLGDHYKWLLNLFKSKVLKDKLDPIDDAFRWIVDLGYSCWVYLKLSKYLRDITGEANSQGRPTVFFRTWGMKGKGKQAAEKPKLTMDFGTYLVFPDVSLCLAIMTGGVVQLVLQYILSVFQELVMSKSLNFCWSIKKKKTLWDKASWSSQLKDFK